MSDTFQNRLTQAMNIKGVKPVDLSKRTGLSKSQISQYMNGIYQAKQTALHKLAIALNVSEAWLMGYDVPMERLHDDVIREEVSALEQVQLLFGKETSEMVKLFLQLNKVGQDKALDTLSDLTAIDKYTNNGKEGE